MNPNIFYVSFDGDKDAISLATQQTVHQLLAKEKTCIPLPEKNWLVITDKDMATLQQQLYDATDSDALYLYSSSEYATLAAAILRPTEEPSTLSATPYSSTQSGTPLLQELQEARTTIIQLMKKNGTLMEENTALRLAAISNRQ